MTPRMPRPWGDSATTTWTGLAVAQKIVAEAGKKTGATLRG